jgi:hypothetical protein
LLSYVELFGERFVDGREVEGSSVGSGRGSGNDLDSGEVLKTDPFHTGAAIDPVYGVT